MTMTKELEEAIEYTKYQVETGNLVRGYTDIYFLQEELKILLNYIENSIPKEKVEETFEYIEDYVERLNGPEEDIEYIKNKKQELLEGK